jgi:hypothetical protein
LFFCGVLCCSSFSLLCLFILFVSILVFTKLKWPMFLLCHQFGKLSDNRNSWRWRGVSRGIITIFFFVVFIYFVCLHSVPCIQCCLCLRLWIVHSWSFLRFSLIIINQQGRVGFSLISFFAPAPKIKISITTWYCFLSSDYVLK